MLIVPTILHCLNTYKGMVIHRSKLGWIFLLTIRIDWMGPEASFQCQAAKAHLPAEIASGRCQTAGEVSEVHRALICIMLPYVCVV